MEAKTIREAAERWVISQRIVAVLCADNRIQDAAIVDNMCCCKKTDEACHLRCGEGSASNIF